MYLKEKKVLVKEIMLDIVNPRLGKKVNYTQEDLAAHLQGGAKSKELLASMKSGLTWVNKIAVVDVNEISTSEEKIYKDYDKNFKKKYKYIAIEGNTRLACLLHEDMREIFNLNEKIPVIIAKKSDGENETEFLGQRKRLQNIANIMVVKDWDEIPKAKQLYESYMIGKEIISMNNRGSSSIERDIFRELAEDIGLSVSAVKKLIYRYIFYKELVENVEQIENKDFKFFEIFEQNKKVRSVFGLDEKSNQFEWLILDDIVNKNDPKKTEKIERIEKKQELLYMFPKLIEIAKYENINSKKLRDIIRANCPNDLENCPDDLDTFYQKVKDIIDSFEKDDDYNCYFSRFFEIKKDIKEDENILKNSIKNIIETLKAFPVNQDFAINFKEDIEEIKNSSDQLLRMLEVIKK